MATRFHEIISDEKPILVDFYATWCGPCKMMTPILQEVKDNMGDSVKIIKVDVDKYPDISNEYQVRGVPTLILFKEGKLLWKESGVHSAAALQEIISKYNS